MSPQRERVSVRNAAVDIVRGLALLSMLVAHTAPSGGPLDLLNLSEFLTAPLFAVLVGIGIGYSTRRSLLRSTARLGPRVVRRAGQALGLRDWASALRKALVRGAVLIIAGLLLQSLGAQVVDILRYLGVLTIVLALVAWIPWPVLLAGALGIGVFSPDVLAGCQPIGSSWLSSFLCSGPYFGHTVLMWGLLGIVLARWLHSRPPRRQQVALLLGGALLAVAIGVYKQANPWDVVPYSGTRLELLLEAGLVAFVIGGCLLLADRLPALVGGVLEQLGRMSLTGYALQIIALALVVRSRATDDSWLVLGALIVGALLMAALWWRFGYGRGPVEALADWLVRRVA